MDFEIPENIVIRTTPNTARLFSRLSMQQEIRFVEGYHMPDHVYMLLQNFWTRVDVVFAVGEVEKSISAALESGMSGSIYIQYPMIKNGKSRIIYHFLTQRVYEVLAEMGKEADVTHVTDIKAIAAAGVLGTPALMINGKIKASGIVPAKSQNKKWIECH